MSDGPYFDGDPATDSARRHMERVLKGEPTRKWPWLLAALGSGTVWMLYRFGLEAAAGRKGSEADPQDPRKPGSTPSGRR